MEDSRAASWKRDSTWDYGLYFTTARLIGIDLGSGGGGALGGTLAGFIKGELMPNLSPEESAKVIEDLDRVKEFDIGRDQIRLIELKKPGLGVGHMTIPSFTRSGPAI